MELIIVFGPPAVGKMTVGREICGLTSYFDLKKSKQLPL
jgi:tRNA uridine 5-carbamoylmethylation protein Kti12